MILPGPLKKKSYHHDPYSSLNDITQLGFLTLSSTLKFQTLLV